MELKKELLLQVLEYAESLDNETIYGKNHITETTWDYRNTDVDYAILVLTTGNNPLINLGSLNGDTFPIGLTFKGHCILQKMRKNPYY
ncbi:hypothetical protein ACYSNR_17575 [Enterococcus sp. LJL128]